jgi:DNA-binding NarL/FixJ family response regulator
VVSDVLLYREGLSSYLQKNGRLHFIGSGPPTEGTLRLLERLLPDAIILDLAMNDSIAFAEHVRDRIRCAKTVAFAVSELDDRVVACAKAGICGYVHKDGTAEDIVETVRHAVRGELHCTPKFAAMLLARLAAITPDAALSTPNPASASKLTSREQQILDHIGCGLTNKEIARQLRISEATVKNHVHHLFEKLEVRRRTQALAVLYGNRGPKRLEATA